MQMSFILFGRFMAQGENYVFTRAYRLLCKHTKKYIFQFV